MENIFKDYKIPEKKEKTPKSRREELINNFVEVINAGLSSGGYKKLDPGVIVIKMAQAGVKSQSQLEWFYGYCSDAKNFCPFWWWYVKENKIKK